MSGTPTIEQLALVCRWALFQKPIAKVVLYGSYYRGDAQPGSDMDFAIWLAGGDRSEMLAKFISNRQRWQHELSTLLGVKVHLEPADPQLADSVPKWVREGGSLLVWERKG